MIKAVLHFICAIRLGLGFCPECNGNAPALYSCDVCNYHIGGYPNKELKQTWKNRFYKKHGLK